MGLSQAAVMVLCLFSLIGGQDRFGLDVRTGLPILQGVEDATRATGSLEYSGNCDGSADFPRVHAVRDGTLSSLQIFRDVFSEDPRIRITQEPGGKIRIVEANLPEDILEVKIRHLSFKVDGTGSSIFNSPYMALHLVLIAPEVRAFMKTHEIGPLEGDVFELPGDAGSSPVRVSEDLDDVTVSQALDYIVHAYSTAQKRPRFWIYKTCGSKSSGRTVAFSFF
jgi:hypothetical protein